MVRSIRFWGLAAKLIEEKCDESHPRGSKLSTTEIGNSLFGKSGWDQYMEFPGTLWLMHWLLLSPRSKLPVWWMAFNEFNVVEFTETELEHTVVRHLEQTADWRVPSKSTIKKDISAMLRTYAPAVRLKHSCIDEVLDCPLRELNLLSYSSSSMKYRFVYGEKSTLPAEILIFALLDFIASTSKEAGTATIGRLAGEPGSPGKIFKLTENQIIKSLERVIIRFPSLSLSSTAGAMQLSWSLSPRSIADQIIDDYYRSLHQFTSLESENVKSQLMAK